MIENFYDVIVVGGGPAGSMAAYAAAKKGVSVLMLEKDKEIGVPVRCAEAVGKEGIENILDDPPDPRWIDAIIRQFKFNAPDGGSFFPTLPGTGYVLNRKIFDFDLAMRAAGVGAQVVTRAYVKGLIKDNGAVKGVHCVIDKKEHSINSRVVIAADGVESRVARWAGLNTTTRLRDMETCCQYTLAGIGTPADVCEFYFNQQEIPGGYAWLFPKGEGIANVGLGIAGNFSRHKAAEARLQEFVAKRFPKASILYKTIGGVPCANRIEKISADGILVAGDAALQGNPLTGGGITTGMVGGKTAGRVAAEAVQTGDCSSTFLHKYEKEWDKRAGKAQQRYYKIKESVKKLTNDDLNAAAAKISALPPNKQTLLRIFQTLLRHQPSIIVEVLKAFRPFA